MLPGQTKYATSLLQFFVGTTLLTTVDAWLKCFQKDGHDSGLLTRAGLSENAIFSVLKDKCGAYTKTNDDCPHWFIERKEYGKGFFGGTSCTYSYHLGMGPDACIDGILPDQCPDGYGTIEDIGITIGIVLASLTLCLITCCLVQYCNRRSSISSNGLVGQSSLQQGLLSSGRVSSYAPADETRDLEGQNQEGNKDLPSPGH